MTYIDYLKAIIDRYALWSLYSERVDDTLTELYALYAELLATDAQSEEAA